MKTIKILNSIFFNIRLYDQSIFFQPFTWSGLTSGYDRNQRGKLFTDHKYKLPYYTFVYFKKIIEIFYNDDLKVAS